MATSIIREQLEARAEDCFRQYEQLTKTTLVRPTYHWDVAGQAAGWAHLDGKTKQYSIRFNPELAERNPDEFFNTIVPHEVSHIIVFQTHPNAKAHGAEWKATMRALGVDDPVRCHQLNTEGLAHTKTTTAFEYQCPQCGRVFSVGRKRHLRALAAKVAIYYHTCDDGSNVALKHTNRTVLKIGGKVVDEIQAAAIAAAPDLKMPTPGSKLARCYDLYRQFPNRYTRKEWINFFVGECGCTERSASTYYTTCYKLFEANVC